MASVQELSTPRARLREVRLDDAEALLDIYGHPEGVRYLGRPPQTLEQVQTRLQRMREEIDRGEAAFWVMTEPAQTGRSPIWASSAGTHRTRPPSWATWSRLRAGARG